MEIDQVAEVLGIGLLATVNLSLWTLRVALMASGRRLAASLLAGVEAILFALVFGRVMSALDDPVRIIGYATGVALGTLIGIVANDRLSSRAALVTVVVDGDGRAELVALDARGWSATSIPATDVRGPVALLSVAVRADAVDRLRDDATEVAPDALVLVEPLQSRQRTRLPDACTPPASTSAVPRRDHHTRPTSPPLAASTGRGHAHPHRVTTHRTTRGARP